MRVGEGGSWRSQASNDVEEERLCAAWRFAGMEEREAPVDPHYTPPSNHKGKA